MVKMTEETKKSAKQQQASLTEVVSFIQILVEEKIEERKKAKIDHLVAISQKALSKY